jgi:hypothetical protein
MPHRMARGGVRTLIEEFGLLAPTDDHSPGAPEARREAIRAAGSGNFQP